MVRRRMDEKGVSPVIGVILMVAITVILAAVIASFVFGMGSSVKKTYLVSATASKSCTTQNGNLICTVYITYQGGPDSDAVNKLTFSADGCTAPSDDTDPTAGDTYQCTGAKSDKTNHIVVTAEFTDGTKQVILDTFV